MGLNQSFTLISQNIHVDLKGPKIKWTLYAGAIIKSEARTVGVQLKRTAELPTVTGLTTKHAVCRISFMLYPVLL